MTLAQVATRAGVSAATVSRVLNGGYPVAERTRRRVLEAVHDLDYVLNAHARALTTASSDTVGVVLHDVSDPYFSEILRGMQAVAGPANRLVVVCNSQRDAARELAYVEMLRRQRADAVLLIGGAIEDDEYTAGLAAHARGLAAQGSRLILCGREWAHADSVTAEHAAGAEQMTRYLLAAGHRDIAFISGPERLSTTRFRLEGFRRGLRSAGLTLPGPLVVGGDFTRDGGYRATEALLRSNGRFSAVFAANDLMAIGALSALRAAGAQVPRDVSVVGFDDVPVMRDLTPPLTTVRVPMQEMGARAMELALERPAGGRPPTVLRLPTELVERESVARLTAGVHPV